MTPKQLRDASNTPWVARCHVCDHDQLAHDYSNPAADFSPCNVYECRCEDFEERDPGQPEPADPF